MITDTSATRTHTNAKRATPPLLSVYHSVALAAALLLLLFPIRLSQHLTASTARHPNTAPHRHTLDMTHASTHKAVNVAKYDGSVPVTSLFCIWKYLCLTRMDTAHAATSAPTRQCIAAAATSHVPKWSRAQSTERLWQGARQLVVEEL
jgi:hypothetical protein